MQRDISIEPIGKLKWNTENIQIIKKMVEQGKKMKQKRRLMKNK